MSSAKKTDPDLWETVKTGVAAGDKGGVPGQWSARKAQMAVQEYKKRGGGYDDSGADQDDTDLHRWTEEDWGTKSGAESGDSGERYLPKKVRMLLTGDEYARSTVKKRKDTQGGGEQFSDQPDDVRAKIAHIKEHGPTKEMLEERARDLDVEGRSSMSKDELLAAIEKATDGEGRGKGPAAGDAHRTRDELYALAQEREIDGRSSMSREELIAALDAR